MSNRVIVIGGGAAGLMAAGQAAAAGAEVVLIEKMPRLGSKIAISGKGRCNLTNAGDISDFIKYYPGNGKFLYASLKQFDNRALIDFFESLGVKTKIERGSRVFPVSDEAETVINALQKFLSRHKVKVILGHTVEELILTDGPKVTGVKFIPTKNNNPGKQDIVSQQEICSAGAVIVATGGASYPGTGSTGDGYIWAAKTGHKVLKPLPALVPLRTLEQWPRELQGLTLKNVEVSIWVDGVKKDKQFGEMLFTHFGISGPVILALSRIASHALAEHKKVEVSINLKPALTPEQLDLRLLRDFSKFRNRHFKNSLDELLPRKMIPVIVSLSEIQPDKMTNEINKKERQKLGGLLQDLRLNVTATLGMATAIVTSGGVDTKQINPATMESRLVKGLFWAGEVIDIDGITGGYNLQAAFSTGYKAGRAAANAVADNVANNN
ncbi:MAG: NAD(P)/FAD-dependent oxidoreductase [Peptococcaceae bacterium]|nr:NAD(P)/FAD-dependent oxidoreductase [Peptococcaceae bacterium]